MAAFDPDLWHDFFVMSGGAAAVLAGLIFVAVSLNHEQILDGPVLPALAAQTLGTLTGVVMVCALGLAPSQPLPVFGAELVAIGLATSAIVLVTTLHALPHLENRWWALSRALVGAIAAGPVLVAGISVLAGTGGGLFWCLFEVVAAFGVATYHSWILLVEIRR